MYFGDLLAEIHFLKYNSMEDDNEDDLKNKADLHIAGRHTVLDIFRFAVFFLGACFFFLFYFKFIHTKIKKI